MRTSIVVARVMLLLALHTSAAAGESYLPPQAAAAMLSDGAPWSAETPDGHRKFRITLNPDGTGRLRGESRRSLLFSQNISWRIEGPTICLASLFVKKCLQFRESPGGLQGWEQDQPDLRLRR